MHTYSEMITIVKLINISPNIVTFFVSVLIAPEIYYLSKFPLFNAVSLSTVMLYIRSLDLFILRNCYFPFFDQHFPLSLASKSLVTNSTL